MGELSEQSAPNSAKPSSLSGSTDTVATTADQEWAATQQGEEEERINADVLQLARWLTTKSLGAPGSLFPAPEDGPLNPNSA
ncbi:hypothetical protein ACJZ2D_013277 [Fusarium nematophilum]